MHMQNELLSIPVAAGTLATAFAALSLVCRNLRQTISADKLALMGVLGAFVFAGQMVNFPLPAMPGTSGHMVGAVLMAVILGPNTATIVMSSVVIIQCLIFQDGGLLALGCNIINMALVPSYLGYFLYKTLTSANPSRLRAYFGASVACLVAVEVGAVLVPIEVALSGVLMVPFSTFLATMLGVHLLVGLAESLITVAVLTYLQQVRPDVTMGHLSGKVRLSRKALLATLAVFAVIASAGLSLVASGLPDGLEWSYAERPDQPDFEPVVSKEDPKIAAVDDFHSRYSLLPYYTIRVAELGKIAEEETETAAGWTSFAGVVGSAFTMTVIWLVARILRKRTRAVSIAP